MPSLLTRAADAVKAARLSFSGTPYAYTPKLWGPGYLGNWSAVTGGAFDAERAAGELRLNSIVQACIAWMQRTYGKPRLVVQRREDDEWKEVPNHPLPRLVYRPNRRYAGAQLWQRTLSDWVPSGNGYWVKLRDGTGKPTELWHRPECTMRPDWPEDRDDIFISQYLQRTRKGQDVPWKVQDVVHLRFGYDPDNERLGWSPLRAGLNEIATLNNGAKYRGGLLDQQGVPAHALEVEDKETLDDLKTKPQSFFDDMRAKFRALFSKSGAGNLFIPSFPSKLVKVGFSPAELDIISMLAWDSDVVCALLGLSSMVVGLPSGNGQRTYANQADAREAAFEHCIMPYQEANAQDLTLQLLPDFETDLENFRVAWDYSKVDVLQGDVLKKQTILLAAQKQGVMTVSETRSQGWSLKKLTPEQEQEVEAAKPQPPGLGAGQPESGGDRNALQQGRSSSQGQPFSRNGTTGVNGKALAGSTILVPAGAVKAEPEAEYRVAEVDPGEIAAGEFSGLEEFWTQRQARWKDEVEEPAAKFNPNHDPHSGQFSSGGGIAGSGLEGPAETPTPSQKSILAKQSAKYVGKDIQRYSEEHNEPILAAALKHGGHNALSLRDNEPVDVIRTKGGKITDGVELKTMSTAGNDKLTMKGSALARKRTWMQENGADFHTVVFDDRKVFNAKGPGQHDESQRVMYYKRGSGSFRLSSMQRVQDMAELRSLMDSPLTSLPKGAQPLAGYEGFK